jgi:hypothetical protein
MKPETKQAWLDVGEIIGRYMPKMVCFGYYIFFAFAFYYIVDWYMAYDWDTVREPTIALAITAFPTAILGLLIQLLKTLTEVAFRAMNGHAASVPKN